MSDHPPTPPRRTPWHGLSSPCVLSLGLSGLAALASCTVGPDFKPPQQETPAAWVGTKDASAAAPAPATSTTNAQAPDIVAWWTVLNDPQLTSLIDRAVAANLDLRLAEARLRQARAERTIAAAGFWPIVNADASANRARTPIPTSSGGSGGTTSNFYRAGFDASWEIDVFGGTRRNVEAAEAGIESAVWDQRDVLVIVAAEVASTYIQLRGLQRQLEVARENLAAQEQSAAITRQRYEGGFVSGLDAANAEAQVANTRAAIPAFESAAQQARYALAVLLAQDPGALLAELDGSAPLPTPPAAIPVGLPSELLMRRPDLRRADAQLHAANARIGVATADLFPKFSLTGSFGLEGGKIGALSTAADRFWSLGPAMTWNIFSAGAVRANIDVQQALTDQAFDVYRKAVLTSLQEVESALIAYAREQERRASLADAVDASQRAVTIATLQYTEGQTDFLNVLAAQRTLFLSEDALAQSQTAVVNDLVALYKALGGGWAEETAGSELQP